MVIDLWGECLSWHYRALYAGGSALQDLCDSQTAVQGWAQPPCHLPSVKAAYCPASFTWESPAAPALGWEIPGSCAGAGLGAARPAPSACTAVFVEPRGDSILVGLTKA